MNHNVSQNGEGHWNPSELLLDREMIRERKNLAELENEWVNLIRRFDWHHWMVGTFAPTRSLYAPWREESRASSGMIDTGDGTRSGDVKGERIVTLETAVREHARFIRGEGVLTPEAAAREHALFIRRLERTGNPVWWLYVAEHGWAGGRIHNHVLLGGTDHLWRDDIKKAWRAGWSEIDYYRPTLKGAEYIMKQLKFGVEPDIAGKIYGKIARWRAVRANTPVKIIPPDAIRGVDR